MNKKGTIPLTQENSSYKQYFGDRDIFVPDNDREQYLTTHDMTIKYLSNGITIGGATCYVQDARYATIDFVFPHAAYYEPKGKSGITHFLEHIISNDPLNCARKNDAYYNASTNAKELVLMVRGTANPKVKDYGIWPVLDCVYDKLLHPTVITDTLLGNEKNVILHELQQYEADYAYRAAFAFRDVLYDSSHPSLYKAIGKEEDIKSLTTKDFRMYQEQVFIPRGLEVSIYTEGRKAITKKLLEQVEDVLRGMPNADKAPVTIPDSLFAKVNPHTQAGGVYCKDIGLHNGLVQVNFAWVFPATSFTTFTFAMTRFFDVIEQKIFQFLRESGLVYSVEPFSSELGDKKRVVGFELTISKRPDIEEHAAHIYSLIKKEILPVFGDSECVYIANMTKKRLEAQPETVRTRLGDALYGLKNYGKIIDSKEVMRIHQQITPAHLQQVKDLFLSTDPITVIVGDLE